MKAAIAPQAWGRKEFTPASAERVKREKLGVCAVGWVNAWATRSSANGELGGRSKGRSGGHGGDGAGGGRRATGRSARDWLAG